jgi:hypothetical protein
MARMNEGFSRHVQQETVAPDWSLVPISDQPPPSANNTDPRWAPQGPGWFDSSWLLRQGLEVTELCSVGLLDSVLRALQMQSPPNESVHHVPA